MKRFLTIASTIALAVGTPAAAATLIVDGSGVLTGATGVDVGGTLYDVSFLDGTCSAIFSGCDNVSDFTFTQAQAINASQALLDQVLIDGGAGAFDTNYALTAGCGTNSFGYCAITIPYGITVTVFLSRQAGNYASVGDGVYGPFGGSPTTFDTSTFANYTWATFTPAPAVPEPSTWMMLLLGFGAIGSAMRRSKKQPRIQRV